MSVTLPKIVMLWAKKMPGKKQKIKNNSKLLGMYYRACFFRFLFGYSEKDVLKLTMFC